MARPLVVPILPAFDILPSTAQIKRALGNALTGTAKAIKIDYDVTTQTWTRRPTFTIETTAWNERLISTSNEIYGYVTGGTKPHPIRARNAPALSFQWGGPGSYKAKTTPRVIASTSGGSSGPIVYRQEVQHPGFPGREFEKVISDKWRLRWTPIVHRAIASELKR